MGRQQETEAHCKVHGFILFLVFAPSENYRVAHGVFRIVYGVGPAATKIGASKGIGGHTGTPNCIKYPCNNFSTIINASSIFILTDLQKIANG